MSRSTLFAATLLLALGCVSPPPTNPPTAAPQIDQGVLSQAYKDAAATWYLTASNVDPPLTWSVEKPSSLSWLQLDPSEGILYGTPPEVVTTTIKVRAVDSADRVVERSFTLSVVACQDGVTKDCSVAAAGACTVGRQTCVGGAFGACTGTPSTVPATCGQLGGTGTCSSCGPGGAYADSCDAGATCKCGAGAACTGAHATTSCTGGACVNSCSAGWGDCDSTPQNGCEQALNTDAHCTGCGVRCDPPANGGAASCGSGACVKTCPANMTNGGGTCACNAGWGDCDANLGNGCERPTTGDVNNCGGCNVVCPGVTNGSPECRTLSGTGVCSFTCNAGYVVCNGACVLSGYCGGGGGGGGCFVAGTPVTMADGTTKPIDRIEAGDRVLAMDPDTRTITAAVVDYPISHDATPAPLVRINGRLVATPGHPFFVGGAWRAALELRLGDVLVTAIQQGEGFEPATTIVTQLELVDGGAPVYNLEVAGLHDYFADGVLVHNYLKL